MFCPLNASPPKGDSLKTGPKVMFKRNAHGKYGDPRHDEIYIYTQKNTCESTTGGSSGSRALTLAFGAGFGAGTFAWQLSKGYG